MTVYESMLEEYRRKNFRHLQARIKEFSGEEISLEDFMHKLREKLADRIKFL